MDTKTSLLSQLENPNLTRDQRAELRCQLARELEEAGDYEAARRAMDEFWQRVGERPILDGLEAVMRGEVLLRVGVLTGWLGSQNQIAGAQETAKNLISESAAIFESHNYAKKVLEAQTDLAYCYWREGAHDEARVILQDVLGRLTADSELKAKAVVRLGIVEWAARRHADSLRLLTEAAPLFEKIASHTIKGGYHNALACVLEDMGAAEQRADYLDRAFIEYTAASYHFEQGGHKVYQANVENNLGFLYFKADRFTEAHEHLDHARRLLMSLKDRGGVAQVDETRARVYLAEGRNTEAERTANAAVNALGDGGRQSLLAEALITHATALARLRHHDLARLNFLRAMETAHQSGALNDAGMAALTMLEVLSDHVEIDEQHTVFERAYCWLTPSQNLATLQRLLRSASRVLSAGRKFKPTAPREMSLITEPGTATLDEIMRRFENNIIRQALEVSEGSITRAAHLLGISHQRLGYILESRQRDLRSVRTPARHRQGITKKRPR